MPITITTLNTDAGNPKTFIEIGKDKANAEWLNADTTFESRVFIRQMLMKRDPATGVQYRRSLVKLIARKPVAGTTPARSEMVTINVTIEAPVSFEVLSSAHAKDTMAFARNLLAGTVVDQLLQGQV